MKKLVLLLTSTLFFLARLTWASCSLNTPTMTTSMPLQLGNMTIGTEVADGTQLYKQTYNLNFNAGNSTTSTCTGEGQFYAYYSFSSTPLPLSSWSEKVYETGVPGIGVYVGQGTNGGITMPDKKELFPLNGHTGTCTGNSCTPFEGFKRWDIYLVKTGAIAPGIIQGSQLPCVQVNYTNEAPSANNMVENVCMSGAINIVASTCKTPDVMVEMGSHPVTELSGINSTTGWVDASIQLTDCPTFYGYGSSGHWYVDNSGTSNSGTPTNNKVELKLTPNTDVIDSSNGVFAINTGASSASGIGIQLAYGTNASPTMVNFASPNTYVMGNGSSGNVTLPLVARYIQTETNVRAGQANSALTFLINYY